MSGQTSSLRRISLGHRQLMLLTVALALLATGVSCTAPAMTPTAATDTSAPSPTLGPPSGAGGPTATPARDPSPPVPTDGTLRPTGTLPIPVTTPEDATPSGSHSRPEVEAARADLAAHLGLPAAEIELVEVRSVTWPDSGLGCPQPDTAYTQVPQDGLLIRLRAAGQEYNYHSGGTRPPFLCEPRVPSAKSTPASIEDVISPPGSDLDE